MDQTPLLDKYDRIAELRQVSHSRLGIILLKNGRVRDSLADGTMTIKRAQDLDRRLDELEGELLEKIRRGEPVSQRGRPRSAA